MAEQAERGGEKLYYRIGEVSQQIGVAAHTIRYWEKEFRLGRPRRNSRGHRVYTGAEVAKLLRLKELLYGRGLRISAAKRVLRESASKSRKAAVGQPPLRRLAQELRRLDKTLEQLARLEAGD